jgi:hypothetical protein
MPRTFGRLRSPFLATSLAVFASLILTGCARGNLFELTGNFWSYGICSAIIVILDVVALLEIYRSERATGEKIVWSLVIILFPVLGCVAYYFFGRN